MPMQSFHVLVETDATDVKSCSTGSLNGKSPSRDNRRFRARAMQRYQGDEVIALCLPVVRSTCLPFHEEGWTPTNQQFKRS
jgi:hypothetical protein